MPTSVLLKDSFVDYLRVSFCEEANKLLILIMKSTKT